MIWNSILEWELLFTRLKKKLFYFLHNSIKVIKYEKMILKKHIQNLNGFNTKKTLWNLLLELDHKGGKDGYWKVWDIVLMKSICKSCADFQPIIVFNKHTPRTKKKQKNKEQNKNKNRRRDNPTSHDFQLHTPNDR